MLTWKDFEMSSSWFAKWARQWTHEYVRWQAGGKYARNVFATIADFADWFEPPLATDFPFVADTFPLSTPLPLAAAEATAAAAWPPTGC